MRNVISVLSSTSGTPLPGFPLRRLPVAAATPLLLSVEVVPPQYFSGNLGETHYKAERQLKTTSSFVTTNFNPDFISVDDTMPSKTSRPVT